MISVRERPPLTLSILVEAPDGQVTRWGPDERDPGRKPGALTFGTSMPGGFEQASCTLERDPERDWPDLEELSEVRIIGLGGGQTAWEGRLEGAPASSGDDRQASPQLTGWQAHLDDNQSAREIFVDISQADWQGASVQRQINLLLASIDETDATTGPDYTSGEPSITTQLAGAWTREASSEAWYDSDGIPLGLIYYAWKLQASDAIGDLVATDFEWAVALSADDVASSYDQTVISAAGPSGSGTLDATTATREFARLALLATSAGGTQGVSYPVFWTMAAVYGTHGLPLQGSGSLTTAPGVLASDVVAYALGRWCPKLNFSKGAAGTIQPSEFVIPQLVVTTPGGASAIVNAATAFELQDWAVWENRTFWMYPYGPGPINRRWRARVGPCNLQDTGPQIARLYNGVILTYTDVTGIARSVGPPGSGCTVESPLLLDPDPTNPATQAGIPLWSPPIQLGTSVATIAIKAGQSYLAQQAALSTAGQATLTGHIQDDRGVWWPTWMVRSGDEISFVDASSTDYRRIVSTSYDDTQKQNTISLDSPPDGMQQLIARISVDVADTGFS